MLSQVTNWSVKRKFSLILAILFLPASLTFSFFTYRQEYLTRVEAETAKARLVAGSLNEHWSELIQGMETGAGAGSFGKAAENSVSGFSHSSELVTRILGPSLSVRYVSLTPLNPRNRADSFEQEGIRMLEREEGDQDEYVKLSWLEGEKAIRYLKPLRGKDACLQCHRSPKSTAATSMGHSPSGEAGSVDREGAMLLGCISITVPYRVFGLPLEKNLERSVLVNFGIFGFMILVWLIFAKVHIQDRLDELSKEMAAVAGGEDGRSDGAEEIRGSRNEEIRGSRNDEIGSLFASFYAMRSQVRQRVQLLKGEAELCQSLARSAVFGVIVLDIEGKILLFNDGAEKIFGWKRGEVLNQKATLLIPPKLRREYKYALMQRLRDARLREEPIEAPGMRKDGVEFFARLSVSAGKTSGGRIFTVIIQDITEQKRKEGEMSRQNEKLVLLNQISTELLLERDLKKLAERSLDESLELTDSPFGLFLLKNKDGDLVPLTMMGLSAHKEENEEVPQVFRPIGVLGEIMRKKMPYLINTRPRLASVGENRTVLSFGKFSFYSFLGAPIISDGEVIGVICVANRPEGYTGKEQELLSALADDLSLLIIRNAVEKETRVLKEEFQTLFDQSSDMIVLCNLEGRIIAVNYRVVQYTGYAYQELIDYAFWKLHLPDEERKCREFLKRVLKMETFRLESIFRQKNGGSFPVDLHAHVVAFGDQKVIQVVIRDMIQSKKAESDFKNQIESLTKRLAEYRREMTFFRMVVDTLSEYVILTDRTGRILLANASFCQRFGYAQDELVGQPVEFLFSPDLSIDTVDQIITHAMEKGWNGGVVHLTKGGQKIQLKLSMQAVHDPGNGIFGLVGIYSECMV
ncbi:MAG: PAS domain S-box protein [bacterium]